eukprot:GDKK01069716.1.p3 GENE.GDKK01069716.1~~GDKK01069716.1.p3  ORF type:complete len:101 (-),score=23.37 GDKK01069716.1:108-410(-)
MGGHPAIKDSKDIRAITGGIITITISSSNKHSNKNTAIIEIRGINMEMVTQPTGTGITDLIMNSKLIPMNHAAVSNRMVIKAAGMLVVEGATTTTTTEEK